MGDPSSPRGAAAAPSGDTAGQAGWESFVTRGTTTQATNKTASPGELAHPSLGTWAPGSEGTARTRSAGGDTESRCPREPCSVRGRGQALFGGQQRQQEDAKEGTGRGPCAPGPRSFMTTHRGWQGQTSDESPQPTGRNGRNWGDPTRRDSQENTRREECLFPKRGSPPGRSRHTRAVKSHLQPSGELGQEQTSASSFRTPTNTEHAHDDRKQILSSGL